MRHPKNMTRYKTLDRLAADPRVIEIWDEGEDGLWATLADDWWNWDAGGTSGVHAETVRDLLYQFRWYVKPRGQR
jgi:hypothetical protein